MQRDSTAVEEGLESPPDDGPQLQEIRIPSSDQPFGSNLYYQWNSADAASPPPAADHDLQRTRQEFAGNINLVSNVN